MDHTPQFFRLAGRKCSPHKGFAGATGGCLELVPDFPESGPRVGGVSCHPAAAFPVVVNMTTVQGKLRLFLKRKSSKSSEESSAKEREARMRTFFPTS